MTASPSTATRPLPILLIYPPVGSPFAPYPALPALAANLRRNGLEAQVLDASIEFWRELLAPESLRWGLDQAADRVHALNERPRMHFQEMVEFNRLLRTLAAAHGHEEELLTVTDDARNSDPNRRFRDVAKAANLMGSVNFPNVLDVSGPFARFISAGCSYSSGDIAAETEADSFYPEILSRILGRALSATSRSIVGISLTFPDQTLPAFQCARHVKRLRPDAFVVMGGAFVSCHLRDVTNPALFRYVDAYLLDDGEAPLLRLAEELQAPRPDFRSVPSMRWMDRGAIVQTPPAPPSDLGALDVPDYSQLPLDRYFLPRHALTLPLRLSRGCRWAKCAFCRTSLSMVHDYQEIPSEVVFEHIRSVHHATGVTRLQFSDDSASPLELERLSRWLLAERLPINWFTSARFDPRLTVERAALFKKAGCGHLFLGMEAYNDRLLSLISKGITTELVDRLLSNLSWGGLPAVAYMILGLPTETEEEALASISAIEAMTRDGRLQSSIFSPFQVVAHSDIGLHPEKYDITRVIIPEGMDLAPPVFDFEGRGMSRKRMFALLERTKNLVTMGISLDAMHRHLRDYVVPVGEEMQVGGRAMRLRYDLPTLQQIIHDESCTTLSFRSWMRERNQAIRPILQGEVRVPE